MSDNKLMAMDVNPNSPVFQPNVAKPLFELHLQTWQHRRYQVAASGRRFLANVPVESVFSNYRGNQLGTDRER